MSHRPAPGIAPSGKDSPPSPPPLPVHSGLSPGPADHSPGDRPVLQKVSLLPEGSAQGPASKYSQPRKPGAAQKIGRKLGAGGKTPEAGGAGTGPDTPPHPGGVGKDSQR